MGLLGNLGQLGGLLKQAQQMQQKMQQLQEVLAEQRFEAEAGAGLVKATVNGRGDLVRIKLKPDALSPSEAEMLEELIKSAVCAASDKAQQCYRQEIGKVTGGLNLPGLSEMLGLGALPEPEATQ
ncbi:MAG TPA: YbaB/EbfC family nucleoid-associated protein [Phycisphaerae bacterium]|nr:YbaB/EbfC family nucleoid-associated protein [Phycisphaerae bacterium]